MKTSKEHQSLINILENIARTYQGLWSAFSNAKYHGLAAFAEYEARERIKNAEQISQHLAEHGEHVQFGAIPAPACNYKTPLEAIETAYKAEENVSNIATVAHNAVVQANERNYFIKELINKLDKDRNEVAEIKSMLANASTPEQLAVINQSLLKKYSGNA